MIIVFPLFQNLDLTSVPCIVCIGHNSISMLNNNGGSYIPDFVSNFNEYVSVKTYVAIGFR